MDFLTAGDQKKPEHMLTVLHGMGRNAECYMPLAEQFAASLPHTAVLIPQAPLFIKVPDEDLPIIREKYPDFDPAQAKSWFDMSIHTMPLRLLFNRMSVFDELNTLIDSQLAQHHLQSD